MASHHLVEDTFNAEFEGPDIQAHDLCPSISLPTFLAPRRGSNCVRRVVHSPSLCPLLRTSIKENESRVANGGICPNRAEKNPRAP
jgi:hypothetical protein